MLVNAPWYVSNQTFHQVRAKEATRQKSSQMGIHDHALEQTLL